MLWLVTDASVRVAAHIPFDSIYIWIGFCKNWQMWRPARYKQWQLNIVGFELTKLLQTMTRGTNLMQQLW